MKKLLLLITLVSLPSYAAINANVSFVSDYIWRGMTQSDGPAIQGGFDYTSDSGFYAGMWGSNVNFNDGNGAELDYYFGYEFEVNSLSVDVNYISYDFPDSKSDLDFEEINIGFAMGDFGFTLAFGQDGAPNYSELSYEISSVEMSYGKYDDYGDNFTISYGFSCVSYECAIAYSDFSENGYGSNEDALIFTISASL